MSVTIRVLRKGDEAVLRTVASGVFDNEVRASLAAEFLADPRHHIAVALDSGVVVGFASGVDYAHPDKPPEFWINEVGVAPSHMRQGLGRKILTELFEVARRCGCVNAWVLANKSNEPAMGLYASMSGASKAADCVMFEFDLLAKPD